MPSVAELLSNALQLIGDTSINAADLVALSTDRARLANALWPTCRDFVLRSHPWNCVIRRVQTTSPGLSSIDRALALEIIGNFAVHDDLTTSHSGVRGTSGVLVTSGAKKYYFEVVVRKISTDMSIGLGRSNASLIALVGGDANGWGYRASNGQKYTGNVGSAYGNTYTAGDVIGVAFNAATGELWFAKNNVWQNAGVPESGTGEAFTLTGTVYPMLALFDQASYVEVKFKGFTYTPPSGFFGWPASAGIFEWPYEHDLPSDCLRLLSVGEESEAINYRIEGRSVLSDDSELAMRYVYRETDPNRYDSALVAAMEAYLAMKFAYPITKSNTTADSMQKLFAYQLQQARTLDALENPPEESQDFPFISVRGR